MKIFVTGSTGYIGGAVVKELVQAGHQVTGLFHKPEKEALLKSLGAAGIQGDLTNVEAWKDQAADHEAIIHAGFAQGMEGGAIDRKVVEALLGAAQAKGVTQSFIYTSGTWVLGKAGYDPANESTPTDYPNPIVAWRPAVEQLALQGGSGKLKTAVIRPGVVYGGKGGLLAGFWDSAVKKGTVTYIGKGENVWSCVYRGDLALLYRLVAGKKGFRHFSRGRRRFPPTAGSGPGGFADCRQTRLGPKPAGGRGPKDDGAIRRRAGGVGPDGLGLSAERIGMEAPLRFFHPGRPAGF